MSETQHTPGKWTAEQSGAEHHKSREWVIRQNGAPSVAVVCGGWSATAEANARLIASAPDLLAENRALRSALEQLVDHATHDGALGNGEVAVVAARAFLAKLASLDGGKS